MSASSTGGIGPAPKNLELSVTNFGPIARAKIDLRPMTVFVGPSNTGKSYLAMLVYALHRFFNDQALDYIFRSRSNPGAGGFTVFDAPVPEDDRPMYPEDIDGLIKWFSAISSQEQEVAVPEPFAKLVRLRLRGAGELANLLDRELARCFGIFNTRDLVRNRAGSGAKVSVDRQISDADDRVESIGYEFTIDGSERELTPSIPDAMPIRLAQTDGSSPYQIVDNLRLLLNSLRNASNEDDRQTRSDIMIMEFARGSGSYLVNPLSRAAYYLPADRAGVMHAHQLVVSSLVRNASRAGLQREQPLPSLSGVQADFLEQLIQLGERDAQQRRRTSDSPDLAARLEQEILKGAVHRKESATGYPVFFYQPEGWKEDLPLMNTSSMVSELAPVALYLRQVVSPGETLIIEEPESHLHPAIQVEFTRLLAAAIKSGVRVILTTHSEWVLEELANLVHLSELPESKREGLAGADFALSPNEVGVWLFEPKQRPRGSVVREIPMDVESGTFPAGYSLTTEALYNRWVDISSEMEWNRTR